MMVNGIKLYEHQIKGIEFMLKHRFGVANFSQMGTGKTCMTVCAMNKLTPARVLIVCPNPLKFVWEREIAKWSEVDYKVTILNGTRDKKVRLLSEVSGPFNIVVVNYESLFTLEEELVKFGAQLIVADEAHKIKGHKTDQTKALKRIATRSRTECRWILTGTPTPNNPLDIWSQYDFIRPGFLSPNFYSFRGTYANVYTGAGFPMIKGYKNEDILKKLVATYSYRVIKEECLDLPEKVYETVEIDMSPKASKIYKSMADYMIAEIGEQEVSANIVLVKLLRLQQITSGFVRTDLGRDQDVGDDKLKALAELLESINGDYLYSRKEKVVIWCRFNYEVQKIAEMVRAMKRPVHLLTGEVSNEDRQKAVESFQASNANDVIIANIAVGGTGFTLTASRYAIYFSRTFSLGDAQQSEDRIHRIGQQHKVTYYDLVCKGTIDAYILDLLKKKKNLSDKLTGDDVKRIALGLT